MLYLTLQYTAIKDSAAYVRARILALIRALSHVTTRCYQGCCATWHDRLHVRRDIAVHVCLLSWRCPVLSRVLQQLRERENAKQLRV